MDWWTQVTYPNMMEFFESLGVDMELSDMSFAVSLDKGRGYEWGSRNGLSGLFAQKTNALNPYFWQMIREIIKFKDDAIRQVLTLLCLYPSLSNASNHILTHAVICRYPHFLFVSHCSYIDMLENNPDMDHSESLGQFLKSRGYSELFQKAYLVSSIIH